MKLTEFKIGAEVTIASTKNKRHHEFETEIISIRSRQNLVFVKPVMINGRMVRFSDPDISHVVTVTAGSKVYAYRDVTIKEVQSRSDEKKFALCIHSEESVEPVNRREFFRVFLGVSGMIQAGVGTRTQEVVIKDVSANGIGVICPDTLRISIGTSVYVDFIDELTEEEFKLNCVVVRCVRHDEKHVVYGCQLPESSDDMERFVALKQRIH